MKNFYYQSSESSQSVEKFLRNYTNDPPLVTWVEPIPKIPLKSISNNIAILQSGLPTMDSSYDEARLFWKNKALHVVADQEKKGCYWFIYGEESWKKDEVELLKPDQYNKSERFVILCDAHHRELQRKKGWTQYKMIEYYQGNQFLAWRIVPILGWADKLPLFIQRLFHKLNYSLK